MYVVTPVTDAMILGDRRKGEKHWNPQQRVGGVGAILRGKGMLVLSRCAHRYWRQVGRIFEREVSTPSAGGIRCRHHAESSLEAQHSPTIRQDIQSYKFTYIPVLFSRTYYTSALAQKKWQQKQEDLGVVHTRTPGQRKEVRKLPQEQQ